MSESPADLLRRAADKLENPPIRPGVTVQYVSRGDRAVEAWRRRNGRQYLVVEPSMHQRGSTEPTVTVWVPADHEDDSCAGDCIYPTADRLVVVVSEQDKALAAWLRHQATYAELSGSEYLTGHGRHARAIARAILSEDQL